MFSSLMSYSLGRNWTSVGRRNQTKTKEKKAEKGGGAFAARKLEKENCCCEE